MTIISNLPDRWDEEFDLVEVGVDPDGNLFAFVAGPVPVGE